MNMDIFYIVIIVVFVVLLVSALVLWAIESRMQSKRKRALAEKIESGKGIRVECDDLFLHVKDGTVEILDAAPNVSTLVSELAEDEDEPILMPFDEDAAAQPEELAAAEDVSEEPMVAVTENSVVFERAETSAVRFIDKYAALSMEDRARYDRLVQYILSEPLCRKTESSGAVTFKYKTEKIARVVIKRGVVVFNFMLANTDLNRFVREGGIKKIKISPVVVRLESDLDAEIARQTVDIAINNMREEFEYRKERNKERRRQLKQQKAEKSVENNMNGGKV